MTANPATTDEITAFFQHFSAGSAQLDQDALATCFAEVFLAGDASSIRPVQRATFLQMLPKQAEMFAQAGIGTPTLDHLTFDNLDDHYILARTEWTCSRADGGMIRLISSYLLHRQDGALRVVVYLNHQGLDT
jgi:hypothetical protein